MYIILMMIMIVVMIKAAAVLYNGYSGSGLIIIMLFCKMVSLQQCFFTCLSCFFLSSFAIVDDDNLTWLCTKYVLGLERKSWSLEKVSPYFFLFYA